MIAGSGLNMTADEVADRLLNEIIEAKYPALIKTEKEIHKLEKELAAELQKGESSYKDKTRLYE
jgi:Mg2+ and Co2+ transporter CorA